MEHDLSDGGFAIAVAESAFSGGFGAKVDLKKMIKSGDVTINDTLLFSESNGRILVSVKPENVEAFKEAMKECDCAEIGEVTSGTFLKISGLKDESIVDLDIEELKKSWKGLMNKMH